MMTDGTSNIFNFNIDEPAFTIYDDADTDGLRDYFKIRVGANGQTSIDTVDDDGANAHLIFDVDGYIQYKATNLWLLADTKTASADTDSTFAIEETLDLPSGADGNDKHLGIWYKQTQTNIAGWNNVYLMYIDGGTNKLFSVDKDAKIACNNEIKLSYDSNEYSTMTIEDDATLTIKTTSAGTVDDIILDSGRYIYFYKNGSANGSISSTGSGAGSVFKINTPSHMELSNSAADKDITINAKRHVIIQSDDGTFTPSSDAHVATKKYVDDEISGAGGGSARSVAGDTDNGIISWVTSDNTFAAEANLTFDGTDLLVASTGKLAVGDTATYMHQASDSNLAVVADGDITLDAGDDIVLDADGDVVSVKFGGAAGQIDITNANSGDGIIQQKVDAKDLVIQQYDGNEVVRFTDGGDLKVTNTVYFAAETANTIGNGATGVIDWNVSQKQKVTITGTSITCNFTNPAGPCNLLLKVIQGDGNDVIGTWDTDIKWPTNGTAPTLSTGNGDIDIISFYFDGTNYFGVASLDFA